MSLFQLSCRRGGLPMFELVDSQPCHMVNVDALNLTPGKYPTCTPWQSLFKSMVFQFESRISRISRSDLLWDFSLPSDFSFFKKIPTNKMSAVVMMNEIVSPSLWVC